MAMDDKDDGLQLSLSLKGFESTLQTSSTQSTATPTTPNPPSPTPALQLNLGRRISPSSFEFQRHHQVHPPHRQPISVFRDLHRSAADQHRGAYHHDHIPNSMPQPFMTGGSTTVVDVVNRSPAPALRPANHHPIPMVIELDDDIKASSPHSSTLSSVSGKRSHLAAAVDHREIISDEEDGSGSRSGASGGDDAQGGTGGGESTGGPERKKLRLTKEQASVLEHTFNEHTTLNTKQKLTLAKQLNLKPRQVEVWFQNRRARTKLKQTEVDCEYLKRYCERLTEENRRLHKEVTELKTLRLSPDHHMFNSHMNPPTTLTICSSCERTAAISSSSSSAAVKSSSVPADGSWYRGGHPTTAVMIQKPLNATGLLRI